MVEVEERVEKPDERNKANKGEKNRNTGGKQKKTPKNTYKQSGTLHVMD